MESTTSWTGGGLLLTELGCVSVFEHANKSPAATTTAIKPVLIILNFSTVPTCKNKHPISQ